MKKHTHPFDDQLRKKEEQSLPDLSELETHFEQFRLQQVPTKPLPGRSHSRLWWGLALAGLLCVVFLVYRHRTLVSSETSTEIRQTAEAVALPEVSTTPGSPDTAKEGSGAETEAKKHLVSPIPIQRPGAVPRTRASGRLRFSSRTDPGVRDSLLLSNTNANANQALRQWLEVAKKKPTTFLINNDKDTLLLTAEGSAFYIPARIFPQRGTVHLQVREFYSIDEMLVERLHTVSNNQLLETGGMLQIKAFQNGEPVQLLPGRSFRWYIKQQGDLADMQVFRGRGSEQPDVPWPGEVANWEPLGTRFAGNSPGVYVQAIDFRLEPARIRYGKTTRAKLFVARDTKISNDVLRDSLQRRHPQLDRIKVRRLGPRKIKRSRQHARKTFNGRDWPLARTGLTIGDTVRMSLLDAIRYRLPAIDTFLAFGGNTMISTSSYPKNLHEQMKNRTGVDIYELGWINCDRFLNDPRPRYEFAVELADAARDYVTAIVFTKRKAILFGQRASHNRVHFANLPAGEEITIISFGLQHEQLVISSLKTIVGKNNISLPPYEAAPDNELKTAAHCCWPDQSTK